MMPTFAIYRSRNIKDHVIVEQVAMPDLPAPWFKSGRDGESFERARQADGTYIAPFEASDVDAAQVLAMALVAAAEVGRGGGGLDELSRETGKE